MKDKVLIDTNVAVSILNGEASTKEALRTFSRTYVSITVLGELLFGAKNSQKQQSNLRRIDKLLSACRLLQLGADTAQHYAIIRKQLLDKGRPILENDIWIAAACLEHSLPICTFDKPFEYVDGLDVISL